MLVRVIGLTVLTLATLAGFTGLSAAEPSRVAVERYMATAKVGCFDFKRGRPLPCSLRKVGEIGAIADGAAPDDPTRRMVAIIGHPDENGGNSYTQFAAVFEEADGKWRFVRKVKDVWGQDVRDMRFEDGGRFSYTATMPKDGDPRCCPTGTERLTINIGGLTARNSQTAMPSAASPAAVNAPQGTIEGRLEYPSEEIPRGLTVCAQGLDVDHTWCTSVHKKLPGRRGGLGYSLKVPAGRYHVYGKLPDDDPHAGFPKGYRAYWSEFSKCGNKVSCPSHAPIVVTVEAGRTAGGIIPGDWYNER